MAQIMLENICKSFYVWERPEGGLLRGFFQRKKREVKALRDVSFSIDQGELVGYIGPNGAGKSTTVKVMSGILTPTAGSCEILGRVPWKERVAHVARIGVVFGQRSQLWWDVPAEDSFRMLRDIYGISQADYQSRLKELGEILEFEGLLTTPVRQLSLGQRMRCEIGAALLHRPDILFLDEPTIGLDAVSKLALRDFLKRENQEQGVTMILTTHDMDDIEALCSRVMTIGHGQLLFNGTLADLRRRFSPLRRIRATLAENRAPAALPGAERIEAEGDQCTVWFDREKIPAQEMVAALTGACPVQNLTIEEQDIDELIAAMYQEMQL